MKKTQGMKLVGVGAQMYLMQAERMPSPTRGDTQVSYHNKETLKAHTARTLELRVRAVPT